MDGVAYRIRASGLVQGVGFRPYVHRVAKSLNLKGYVKNLGGSEVEIFVEGNPSDVDSFLEVLNGKLPPPAFIDELYVKREPPRGFKDFKILKSGKLLSIYSMVPPDIGMCENCLREVTDPSSRWYAYPFNSCAWCGPRFSIIYEVPYDRENTSMRDFPLCKECLEDYTTISNVRRYHVEGISCPRCGPKLRLLDSDGKVIESERPLELAAELIEEGFIVAVKGIGGFHIASLATDDEVVLELRRRKRRPQKPFALMALDMNVVEQISEPTALHKKILELPQKPIVLVPKSESSIISEYVAPGIDTLGIMLAYTPLHYLLLSAIEDRVLIMTSGNRRGLPIVKDVRKALAQLRGIADYYLDHNRVIVNRVDDSVVRLTDGQMSFLRRSRGYAPSWIKLPYKLERKVVALGAHLANTGAVAFDRYLVPTQHIGDMDYIEELEFLEDALDFLLRTYKLRIKESVIASDMHPTYTTTRRAREISEKFSLKWVRVQHHHAHIASVMAERGLGPEAETIGIAIDGVGYGMDGSIWGGEILRVRYESFERLGHLSYLPLPGGDAAVRHPPRIVAGFLIEAMDLEEAKRIMGRIGIKNGLSDEELEIIASQLSTSVKVSSVGRFLDAVSVLLGVCLVRHYEGEPAMKLESAARGGGLVDGLKIEIEEGLIDTRKYLLDLIERVGREPVRDLAYTTLISLGRALGEMADAQCDAYGIDTMAVSGGAAVNDYIIRGIKTSTRKKVITNRLLPPGDGGLSVGQAMVAAFRGG